MQVKELERLYKCYLLSYMGMRLGRLDKEKNIG